MNILITGASKGIGRAIALEFCKKGKHSLFLVARNKSLLNELKRQCAEVNPDCIIIDYQFDMANVSMVGQLAEKISHDAHKIDILINNAGTLVNKNFLKISETEISYIFNVNFFAPAALIRSLMPAFLKAGRSHIVNIGSMGGFQGSSKYPGLSFYSASKAAIGVLSECLAEEFKDSGVIINCLALGAVQTEMFSDAFPGAKANISPEEMGEYIVNFALNSDRRVNGKIIPVTNSDLK
jgi:short-subunit dehydrogenase